ncbi:MAG: arginyltransferase [Gammaproteobacteria bacterium]|nr:arginyltransferase [Gammaproteobacteria bacterium]
MSSQNLNLYLTTEHECGYLPDHRATNLVPDPCVQMSMPLYSQLIELGYRRSGSYTYRPHCSNCRQCIPCRIPVARFRPNRSQKRCLQANRDCLIEMKNAGFSDEHFSLYQRYINARHVDGNMANPLPEDYSHFLYSDWSDTFFLEFREESQLLAVAVCDRVNTGLSAVYSYFEPDKPNRSLGTYCVLKMIEQARRMGLDHLYLGYLIHQSQKMRYKQYFRPLEVLVGHRWKDHDRSEIHAAL